MNESTFERGPVHNEVNERINTFKKLTDQFKIKINPTQKDDPHFWYLVSRNYHQQRGRIPDFLNLKIDRDSNLEQIRKLAITNAIDYASDYWKLQKEVATDSNTGAYSKRALDAYLFDIFSKRRKGMADTVAFFDLDHFKQINDQFGHGVGDVALQEFVKLIKEEIRGIDIIGRYGGEEFVLVLPEIDMSEVNWHEKMIERVDSIRKKMEIELANRVGAAYGRGLTLERSLTASVGVFIADDKLVLKRPEELQAKIYDKADKYMYKAKEAGRNKIYDDIGVFPRVK